MKSQVVRNAIDAHGWVGLVISIPLFIIFWAGAITLFYPEVYRWAAMPHFPLTEHEVKVDLNDLLDNTLDDLAYAADHPITLYLPSSHSPYISMRIPLEHADSEEHLRHKQARPLFDPATGEQLSDRRPFGMAEFFDRLHYSLKLPQGLYIVGVFTFFFLVLVFTGLVIQLKNLFTHFFLFRHKKAAKFQMRDIHNVVGVISLPYGLLYALTGVMFNLGILFQIPTLFFLYDGDRNAMLTDAGFPQVIAESTGNKIKTPDIEPLIAKFEQQHNAEVKSLRFYHYQDENAVIALRALENDSFSKRVIRQYEVKSDSYPPELNDDGKNIFSEGTRILYNLHMANYAGLDLRLLYFILAVGVCFMIVAGNVLWIVKRSKPVSHPKTSAVTRALTLGGCMGVVIATAVAFLLERVWPVSDIGRSDFIEQAFGLTLLLTVITGFFAKSIAKFLGVTTAVSGLLLLILALYDGAFYYQTLLTLSEQGFGEALNVSLSLFVVGGALLWFGLTIYRFKPAEPVVKTKRRRKPTSDEIPQLQQ